MGIFLSDVAAKYISGGWCAGVLWRANQYRYIYSMDASKRDTSDVTDQATRTVAVTCVDDVYSYTPHYTCTLAHIPLTSICGFVVNHATGHQVYQAKEDGELNDKCCVSVVQCICNKSN